MAKVLGLSFFYHDSAAALVCDGQVVAAAAEERFCRRKHTSEFPKLAIEYCLEESGLSSINDLDAIVFYEKPAKKLLRVLEGAISTWPRSLVTFATRLPPFLKNKLNVYHTLEKTLAGYHGPLFFSEHHLSHAASGFFCSPFERAAILTLDGVGEFETTTIGTGDGLDIQLKKAIHFPHSIGLLYSALTSYLGFRVNDGEWKVMGLAPYGRPTYVDAFEKLVRQKEDGSFQLNLKYFAHHYSSKRATNEKAWEKLFGFPVRRPQDDLRSYHEDLAHSGQKVVERLIVNLAKSAHALSEGSENLVIAGGVALNSVANWAVEKSGLFKEIWIQPAPGDDGGALGAALAVSQQLFRDPRCKPLRHAYLGPAYSASDISAFLRKRAISVSTLEETALVEKTADLITSGKVVGWFQGRMEFGPRSLGGRSILASPSLPDMKSIINQKVKFREYFRPFAPSVLLEHVHEYFDVPPNTELPFMLKVPAVRPEKRAAIPAVTHQDGTGRVQTVTRESNPLFYRLLQTLKERTGIPVVLNTSFNVRGEPIVCSPEDAYQCYLNSGIDALVLGNHLIIKEAGAVVDKAKGQRESDRLEQALDSDQKRPPRPRLSIVSRAKNISNVTERVLGFYQELAFNYFSSSIDAANTLMKKNRLKDYLTLHRHLMNNPGSSVLDVGCGAGWFTNSCAHFYDANVTGIDINPDALKQARAVSRLIPSRHPSHFVQTNLFDFHPKEGYDVVNSLGVLHHTPDCHGAIKAALGWVKPGGFLHLGLYHLYGRKPFLDHFENLKNEGANEEGLYREFQRLSPGFSDETHLTSWFRDQVLHPHETQHTYEELHDLLNSQGWRIEATSINQFRSLEPHDKMIEQEKKYTAISKRALYRKGQYFPGFFVVWARKRVSGNQVTDVTLPRGNNAARS